MKAIQTTDKIALAISGFSESLHNNDAILGARINVDGVEFDMNLLEKNCLWVNVELPLIDGNGEPILRRTVRALIRRSDRAFDSKFAAKEVWKAFCRNT